MEPLGAQLRRRRLRLGLTLDELAGRTAISKPYLSLIETGRVPNPPSDEKLKRLEQALGFTAGQLLTQAHLQRTPRDVRAVLQNLLATRAGKADDANAAKADDRPKPSSSAKPSPGAAVDLDEAYLSGVLHELVEKSAGNIERVSTNAVPVINRVAAGYPSDFTDLSYPPRVADSYIGVPDLADKDAFAARVHGDSMAPKYREGDIVIFSPAAPPRNGDDCFVRFDDALTTFKRIFYETNDAGIPVIRLQPRNERYPPQLIPSQRIAGLYRAVFRYQRVDEEGP